MQIGLKHFWERGRVYKMMKKLRLRGNEEAGEAGSEGGGIRVRFEDRGFGEDIGHWTLDSECSRRWRLRRPTRGQSWKMSKVWNRKKHQIFYLEQKDGTKFYPRNSLVPILHNGFKQERNLQKSSNINRKSLIWKKVLVTWETHSWTHLNVNWELQKVLKCDLDLTCVSPIPQISIKWEQRLHLFITADASSQILYLATLVNQPGPLKQRLRTQKWPKVNQYEYNDLFTKLKVLVKLIRVALESGQLQWDYFGILWWEQRAIWSFVLSIQKYFRKIWLVHWNLQLLPG